MSKDFFPPRPESRPTIYSTFVPTQKWTRQWTDKDLYASYNLAKDEIAFIESMVRPMPVFCTSWKWRSQCLG